MSNPSPFKGRTTNVTAPMRVLHRFTKPGGHSAEIRERNVTQFRAIEYIVLSMVRRSKASYFTVAAKLNIRQH